MKNIEDIGREIVNAAIKVHRALGPGLLESVYQKCLSYELKQKGFKVDTEVLLPIQYENIKIDAGYRIDMIIDDCIIIENKTVNEFIPIHIAQLLTYLKMKDCRLGFLLNWNVTLMKDGIKRVVNNL